MTKISCSGLKASGVHAGLKKNGKKDLALIFAEAPAEVAAVFTRNQVKAAPVLLSMDRVQQGTCRAIVANSGSANCCTGDRGMQAARQVTRSLAQHLDIADADVLTASTGVIGLPLPVDKIQAALPALVGGLSPDGLTDFAEAIMTTDTVPKIVERRDTIDGIGCTVVGIAKGAGMIAPDMATMLCFVCTDAGIHHQLLHEMLRTAVEKSLNRIVIDGDTSTNDTVFLMASGASGLRIDSPQSGAAFQKQLDDVLLSLAKMLVKDGEGVTKCVEIVITGAGSAQDALAVANTVATSPLVKTALFGEDANWGRLIAAVGRSRVPLNPDRIDIYFDDVQMVKNGMGCGSEAEVQAAGVLKKPEFAITLDLNAGAESAAILTCDFSVDYVKINADYRS